MPKRSDEPPTKERYTSKRDSLATIRRKVDRLKIDTEAVVGEAPKDRSSHLTGVAPTSKKGKRFHPAVVDRKLSGVAFVEKGEAASRKRAAAKQSKAAKKPAKKPAKRTAKKSASKSKARPEPKATSKQVANKDLRPQCAAVTPEGKQCRNSAREGSKYCGSHKGYRPKKSDAKAADTKPRVAKAKDTAPTALKTSAKKAAPTKNPRCSAKTADGKRCKNSARDRSKYCASHKGYRA